MVLGGLKSMTGQLEFFSADDFEVLNAAEHFMCTDVEWDPTGRYVATAVNHMHQMENGFKVWLFNGQLLYQCAPPAQPSPCIFIASWCLCPETQGCHGRSGLCFHHCPQPGFHLVALEDRAAACTF